MTVQTGQAQVKGFTQGQSRVAYTIQPYQLDAMVKVLELTQLSLGSTVVTPKTTDFWLWKHHANPFGASYGLCAWDEQKDLAIGLRVLMHWRFAAKDGRCCQAVRAVDTATHPDYQRLGIFSRLTKQAIAELKQTGVDFIYNTPNSKSLPGYLKMGWQRVARWPLYLKPLRPWGMVGHWLWPQAEAATLPFADYFGSGILSWPAFVQSYGEQATALLGAWETQRESVGLRTPRTLAYFAWRYGQHPTIRYGVYVAIAPSGQLTGFAILRPNLRYGWREVVLTELCLQPATVADGLKTISAPLRPSSRAPSGKWRS